MKKQFLEFVICPCCLPGEYPLRAEIFSEQDGDIESGTLHCPHCRTGFPIVEGLALLDPYASDQQRQTNKYENDEVVSSYLWSQYGDLLNDENASQAYNDWAKLIRSQSGIALDAGGAVGRFTFEMGRRCDFAIGIDTSQAFIRAARQLMRQRSLVVCLKDEGLLHKEVTIRLPDDWRSNKVEFVVANALALPFKKNSISSFSSLNLIDKVPSPLQHLQEMNRVTRDAHAQFLLSDPFSWSIEAAPVNEWLGGKEDGKYAGKGLTNVAALLANGQDKLAPPWHINEQGSFWWKIRTHSNHYELIRSCYVHASR